MNPSQIFVRILFLFLSVLFMTTYALGTSENITIWTAAWGASLGIFFGALLIGVGFLFKRFHLRSFNVTIIGLFLGYLMSLALLSIFNGILEMTTISLREEVVDVFKIFIFLFGAYLGVMMTIKASDEIYLSIPFVKFSPTTQKTKEIILDLSSLSDARVIDLAASGLLDRRLILPRFVLKELQEQEEDADEALRSKAKRALEVVKKLESLPDLSLRFHDGDFSDVKESHEKTIRLGKLIDADILTADLSRLQQPLTEGIRVINLHSLSNALKPLMQRGEFLKIKIQRYGKEEMQGVGYLEDGTMVVVNGGGEYIGETIKARVLSVKHTSSGRMIFCNVEEGETEGIKI